VEGGDIPSSIAENMDRSVDWDDCINRVDRLTCAFYTRAIRATRLAGRPLDVYPEWYRTRDNMIRSGVRLLSAAETINTNRLHALILSALLGRKVNWFDNSYGKLSSYVEGWLHDIPTIQRIY
jgi:pyruvyl transferase EpsO